MQFSLEDAYQGGIKWIWIPTTLLAQADSCIGGKSSLNFKTWKNIITLVEGETQDLDVPLIKKSSLRRIAWEKDLKLPIVSKPIYIDNRHEIVKDISVLCAKTGCFEQYKPNSSGIFDFVRYQNLYVSVHPQLGPSCTYRL